MQHRNFSPQFYFVTFVTIKMTAKFPASNQSNFSLTCIIFVVVLFFLQKLRSWILEHCCTLFFMLLVNISRKISPVPLDSLLPALGCRVVSHRMGHGDGPQLEKSLSLWAKVGLKSIPFFTIRGFLKNYFALRFLLKHSGFLEWKWTLAWICFVLIWKNWVKRAWPFYRRPASELLTLLVNKTKMWKSKENLAAKFLTWKIDMFSVLNETLNRERILWLKNKTLGSI